jgi:hypothetical protein
MGMAFSAEMGRDDRDYDKWLTTLTEASARLDVLQTAVTELCRLCASREVHSDQVLDVLERHDAISKPPVRGFPPPYRYSASVGRAEQSRVVGFGY